MNCVLNYSTDTMPEERLFDEYMYASIFRRHDSALHSWTTRSHCLKCVWTNVMYLPEHGT